MNSKEEIKSEIKKLNDVLSNLISLKQITSKNNGATQIIELIEELSSWLNVNSKYAKRYLDNEFYYGMNITDGVEDLERYLNKTKGFSEESEFSDAVDKIDNGINGIIFELERIS